MMKMRLWPVLAGMVACAGMSAQTLSVEGTFTAGEEGISGLSVNPIGGAVAREGADLDISGFMFGGEVPVSGTGFYMLYGRKGDVQLMQPLYIPRPDGRFRIELASDGGNLRVSGVGKDNEALFAFGQELGKKDRFFWKRERDLKPEELLRFLKSYGQSADSIASACQCSQPVRQYLTLWAYISAKGNYDAIPRALGMDIKELPFAEDDFLPEIRGMIDTPAASCFPAVAYMIRDALPKGRLNERLSYLYGNYHCEDVRAKVAELVADRFVRRFDYSGDYEKGLAELNEAISRYGIDARHAEEFARRRSSAKGAPFPAVELVDADGKRMDFSAFRGYYVYIDLWASWCGPCCREVPYLQKLEKDLQNGQVRFLSISIDKNEAAWKKKMADLDMHGNQWLDSSNALGTALNVQGIPRFLIYDKEGRLYHANAPRPSAPEVLELLENLK